MDLLRFPLGGNAISDVQVSQVGAAAAGGAARRVFVAPRRAPRATTVRRGGDRVLCRSVGDADDPGGAGAGEIRPLRRARPAGAGGVGGSRAAAAEAAGAGAGSAAPRA